MLLYHLERILSHCRTKAWLGKAQAVNRNFNDLLLEAQRMAATRTEVSPFQKTA